MDKNFEKAKGNTSEWRTPKYYFTALRLKFGLDPCAPLDGFYCVPALVCFTIRENGLAQSWRGRGLVYSNPPWSDEREAVVPWLIKFFEEADGGIFVCVARTSASWFQQLVLPRAELICFPSKKTRFHNPDGSLGVSPTNGNAILAKGEIACEALRRSGLGYCVTVDLSAAPPTTRTRSQLVLPLTASANASV
jgi:hypothetical protein